jgi:putative nucleotidyltransferase with HDIG domain
VSEERTAHRLLLVYLASIYVIALVSLALSWRFNAPVWSVAFLLLFVAVVVSENFALAFPTGASISIAFPLTIAAVVLLGPTSAALIGAGDSLSLTELRAKPISRIAYNTASVVLVTLATGWTYVLAGGAPMVRMQGEAITFQPFTAASFAAQIVPMVAAAVVAAVGNVVLTSVVMALALGEDPLHVVRQHAWIVPNEMALALVGFAIAQVLAINPVGLALFVAPLIVARQVYQRYIQLREAYADTIRSLIGVLEAKDPYTRGHSERVAGYAVAAGRQLGLDAVALERLERAALLHDLGKIAVSRSILVKPDRLSDGEYDAIRRHPQTGAEFVARVPSLQDIVPLVRYHHEWYDGRGYCSGLSGDDIPQLARVLSVADAFDAMTTARPYRPARTPEEGVAELIRASGTQFDPDVVTCFIDSSAPHLYSPEELGSLDEELVQRHA